MLEKKWKLTSYFKFGSSWWRVMTGLSFFNKFFDFFLGVSFFDISVKVSSSQFENRLTATLLSSESRLLSLISMSVRKQTLFSIRHEKEPAHHQRMADRGHLSGNLYPKGFIQVGKCEMTSLRDGASEQQTCYRKAWIVSLRKSKKNKCNVFVFSYFKPLPFFSG